MSETSSEATIPLIDPPSGATVWAQRTAKRVYTGHNARGASVTMGPIDMDGAFTPGELLKLALAGCAGMTSDNAISKRLGEDAAATIAVDSAKHETEDRYEFLAEQLLVDLAGLDEAGREELAAVVRRAISKGCTVGLTLEAGAETAIAVVQA
jgi:uncharacterized OsmC-like protein